MHSIRRSVPVSESVKKGRRPRMRKKSDMRATPVSEKPITPPARKAVLKEWVHP